MPVDEDGNWYPGFFEKVVNGTIGYSEWIAAGSPHRHPDETRHNFEEHCLGGDGEPCKEYDPDSRVLGIPGIPKGVCKACGCHVSANPKHLLNKVNKATAECPLQLWLATVRPPEDQENTE